MNKITCSSIWFYLAIVCFFLPSYCCFAQQQGRLTVDSLRQEKNPERLNLKLKQLSGSKQEEDVSTAMMYYISTGHPAQFDSLFHVSAARFPHGRYAFIRAITILSSESNPASQEGLLKKIKIQFPEKAETEELDQAELDIAVKFAQRRNTSKALEHLGRMKGKSNDLTKVADALLKYDPTAVLGLLKDELSRLRTTVPASNSGRKIYSPRYNYELIYSEALIKTGQYKEAIAYAKNAYENPGPAMTSDVLLNYADVLFKNKNYNSALQLLSTAVTEGRSTNISDQQLVSAYHFLYPKQNGHAYLDSLSQTLVTRITKEMTSKIINEPAPAFTITNEQGRVMSLNDLKGKVVVIDFWATWCSPCKASFPAMQQVVDEYKNDSGVCFLFVHTWERSATPLADAKSYLSASKYSLPLYMDTKDSKTNLNPAVTAFGVKSIPAKFIIDSSGHVRFRFTGFIQGHDRASAAEVKAMIELARK